MYEFLNILLYLALAATVITLVFGVAGMLRPRDAQDQEKSNQLMRMRIIFQAVALVILALLLIFSRHS